TARITGTVRSYETGAPVSWAKVAFTSGATGYAIADREGRYTLTKAFDRNTTVVVLASTRNGEYLDSVGRSVNVPGTGLEQVDFVLRLAPYRVIQVFPDAFLFDGT